MIEEKALQKIGGVQKIWVVIDEAQKSPEIFDQIKVLYDEYKGKDKIIHFDWICYFEFASTQC